MKTDHDIEYYIKQKNRLLKDNVERIKMFQAMDEMAHNILVLPAELTRLEGFHQVTPTEPGDSLRVANRILSTVEPKPTYHPLDSTMDSRERANKIEKVLMWHYKRAAKRSVGKLTRDANMSALRYDEIVAQVIDVEWQNRLAGKSKQSKWEPGGDFAIVVQNPKDVYIKRTVYGIQAVFLHKCLTPEDVIDMWGKAAEDVIGKFSNGNGGELPETVFYCDWTDKTDRVVWLDFSATGSSEPDDGHIILAEPHRLPFIPWACAVGGSAIDTEPEYQRSPLLTPIYQSGSWLTQSIMESIMVTETIKTAAMPFFEEETNDGEPIQPNYTVMGGVLSHSPGERVTPIPPRQLDPRMRELVDRTNSRIASSTLPPALGNPSFSAGTAFATVNASLRAASNALDPARTLTEDWLALVFELMLKWKIFTKKPLYAYDYSNSKSENYGSEMFIDPETISPDDIYIDVRLTANLPLDKLSEINAVMMLMKLGLSKERALEMLDMTDPDSVIKEGVQEALTDAEVQNAIKVIAARGDAEAQRILGEVQMQLQQAQMAAQQQPPAPQEAPPEMLAQQGQISPQDMQQQAMARGLAGGSPEDAQAKMMAAGLTDNAGGQGFNPAMGGISPAMAGGPTREQVKLRTQGGEPIA